MRMAESLAQRTQVVIIMEASVNCNLMWIQMDSPMFNSNPNWQAKLIMVMVQYETTMIKKVTR